MSESLSSGPVSVPAPWALEGLRKTSDAAGRLPWGSMLVAIIRVEPGGRVTFAKDIARKVAILGVATDADLLLVAWPGQVSQDIFLLDDRAAARAALAEPLSG